MNNDTLPILPLDISGTFNYTNQISFNQEEPLIEKTPEEVKKETHLETK